MSRTSPTLLAALACLLFAGGCAAPSGKPGSMPAEPFGMSSEGEPVEVYTLRNSRGAEARIATLGGAILSLKVPDREGRPVEVIAGPDRLRDLSGSTPPVGGVLGRCAGRIAKGSFSLDGRTWVLAVNRPPDHADGGIRGFSRVVWEAHPHEEERPPSLELRTISEHGEEGYPGNLVATVVYTLTEENTLRVDFRAMTDRPTICNLTQRTRFNLAGKGSVLDHRLQIAASRFVAVDAGLIPTGELCAVTGTPFDFRRPSAIGARLREANEQLKFGRGYDHHWVLDKAPERLGLAARLSEPSSGRQVEIWTTAPGLHLRIGEGDSNALTLEPQLLPDSPNQPSFPSATLRPGQTWRHTILYTFSAP